MEAFKHISDTHLKPKQHKPGIPSIVEQGHLYTQPYSEEEISLNLLLNPFELLS